MTTYKYNGYTISLEAIDASNAISKLIDENYNNIMICAQPQSGKTGVIIDLAKRYKGKKTVFYLCGDGRLAFKTQIKERCEGLGVKIYCLGEVMDINRKDYQLNFTNAIVCHDESHCATNISATTGLPQHVPKLIQDNIGIDMSKPQSEWTNQSVIMVGISATSFTEQCANDQGHLNRSTVHLAPGKGYIGVSKLLKEGKIFKSFKITKKKATDGYVKLLKIIQLYDEGYLIVRMSSLKFKEGFIEHCKTTDALAGYDIINKHYSDKDGKHINDTLGKKPLKPTIIFIYRALIQGDTINKQYIKCLFESPASTSEGSIQQLLGRACGYYNTPIPDVYTDLKVANEYNSWLDGDKLPSKLKHINHHCTNSNLFDALVPYYKVCKTLPTFIKKGATIIKFLKDLNDPTINEFMESYELVGTSNAETDTNSKQWTSLLESIAKKEPHYTALNGKHLNDIKHDQKQCHLYFKPSTNEIIIMACNKWEKEENPYVILGTTMYMPSTKTTVKETNTTIIKTVKETVTVTENLPVKIKVQKKPAKIKVHTKLEKQGHKTRFKEICALLLEPEVVCNLPMQTLLHVHTVKKSLEKNESPSECDLKNLFASIIIMDQKCPSVEQSEDMLAELLGNF
jgi:hypothetical protein